MATIYTNTPLDTTKKVRTTSVTEEEVPMVSTTPPVITQVVADTGPVVEVYPFFRKINQIIWFLVTLLEILLAFRIALGLLGANYTGFTQFIYNLSYPFVAPFIGIFKSPRVDRSYFDTAAFVAMFAWPLLGWAVTEVLKILDDKK
jgi:uncharacterized protein YggT (Ycf19 family)